MRDYVLMSVLCSLLLFTFAFFPSYRCRYICCLVIILGTETDDAIRCQYRYDIEYFDISAHHRADRIKFSVQTDACSAGQGGRQTGAMTFY